MLLNSAVIVNKTGCRWSRWHTASKLDWLDSLAAYVFERDEMLDSDQKYRAYQLLRELDKSTSTLMNRVAYSNGEKLCWNKELEAQRKAFEEWMNFAATISEDL